MATAAAAAAACAVAAAAQAVPAARDHPWASTAALAKRPRKVMAADKKKPHGAQLIGRDVHIFWEMDRMWYQAHVQYFDPVTRLHTVIYLSDGACECRRSDHDARVKHYSQHSKPCVSP